MAQIKERHMLEICTPSSEENQSITPSLDQIAREGARRMLAHALQAEVDQYIKQHIEERDENGKAMVVRNGNAKSRKVTMGSGTIEVSAPRVHDRRPEKKFTSAILPPYLRRSANVTSLLPILYLKGLSTSDFQPALEQILGSEASGLSSSSISALKKAWQAEFDEWSKREIVQQYAYMFHSPIGFQKTDSISQPDLR